MKENFKLLALEQEIITLIISCSKSGDSLREVVAYKRFQTGKRLTFWKTGRWQAPVVIILFNVLLFYAVCFLSFISTLCSNILETLTRLIIKLLIFQWRWYFSCPPLPGPVYTTQDKFKTAALFLRPRPNVHTNPSRKRSSSNRRNLETLNSVQKAFGKTELYESDDVTIITWFYPLPEFSSNTNEKWPVIAAV